MANHVGPSRKGRVWRQKIASYLLQTPEFVWRRQYLNEIADRAHVTPQQLNVYLRELRQGALFKEGIYPVLENPLHARSGLRAEIIHHLQSGQNPPLDLLAKEYGTTREGVKGYVKSIRQQTGIRRSRGGPNYAFSQAVQQIINSAFKRAKTKRTPVNLRELVFEIARKTGQAVSPNGLLGRLNRFNQENKSRVTADQRGLSRQRGETSLQMVTRLLDEAKIPHDTPRTRKNYAR